MIEEPQEPARDEEEMVDDQHISDGKLSEETNVPKLHGVAGMHIRQANRLIHVARRMKARSNTSQQARSRCEAMPTLLRHICEMPAS